MIFAITFRQWLFEFLFNFQFVVFVLFVKNGSRAFDHFAGLVNCTMMFVVTPSFYFMADASFRRALREDGFLKLCGKL